MSNISNITRHGYIRYRERLNPKARTREQALQEADEKSKQCEKMEKKGVRKKFYTDEGVLVVRGKTLITVIDRDGVEE